MSKTLFKLLLEKITYVLFFSYFNIIENLYIKKLMISSVDPKPFVVQLILNNIVIVMFSVIF